MTVREEARLLSRVLRVGLVAALAAQIAWSFRPQPSRAQTDLVREGEILYNTSCSTCHGIDAAGTDLGPSLQTAGPASIDFMLSTGRMPLANPAAQPTRHDPAFTSREISAMIAYLGAIGAQGEPIPDVDTARGRLPLGLEVFLTDCSACHGAGAGGDSVGGGQIAPSLHEATPTQIGEAVRIGPGQMPRFGPEAIGDEQLDSVAAYIVWLRDHGDPGGLPTGRIGAVIEGMIAVVIGLGMLMLVIRLTGARR